MRVHAREVLPESTILQYNNLLELDKRFLETFTMAQDKKRLAVRDLLLERKARMLQLNQVMHNKDTAVTNS